MSSPSTTQPAAKPSSAAKKNRLQTVNAPPPPPKSNATTSKAPETAKVSTTTTPVVANTSPAPPVNSAAKFWSANPVKSTIALDQPTTTTTAATPPAAPPAAPKRPRSANKPNASPCAPPPPPPPEMLSVPRVINVRKAELCQRGYGSFLDWAANPKNLYIGRSMQQYVPGTVGSKWGNPFPLKQYTLEESLQKYELHVRNSKDLWGALEELDGLEEIGCWCAPAPCHGNVLQRLLAEKLSAAK